MVKIIIVFIISAFFSLSCTKKDQNTVKEQITVPNESYNIILQSMLESTELLDQIVYKGNINELEKWITIDQLFDFSGNDLRILRNTIYAKHGYKFNSIDLQNHFSKFYWYNGEFANVDSKLTIVDIENIKVIQEMERKYAEKITEEYDPMKKQLIGNWYMFGGVSAEGLYNIKSVIEEFGEQLEILPDGTYVYYCRNHSASKGEYHGIWSLENKVFETIPVGEHTGHDERYHPTYRKVELTIGEFEFNNGDIYPCSDLFDHGGWVKDEMLK
jgi:hypothetical protein